MTRKYKMKRPRGPRGPYKERKDKGVPRGAQPERKVRSDKGGRHGPQAERRERSDKGLPSRRGGRARRSWSADAHYLRERMKKLAVAPPRAPRPDIPPEAEALLGTEQLFMDTEYVRNSTNKAPAEATELLGY